MYDMPMQTERDLPYFSLRQIDLPEVREWEVGGEYYLVMKVKMIGKRSMSNLKESNDGTKLEGEFKMLMVEKVDNNSATQKTLEDKAFQKALTRAKSGR